MDFFPTILEMAGLPLRSDLHKDGILIIDEDLVKPKPPRDNIKLFSVQSTRIAEELGNRIIGNLVMLGFFTAVTSVVSPEAMKQALPGLVPGRFLDLNIKGFEKGYEEGLKALGKKTVKTKKKQEAKK